MDIVSKLMNLHEEAAEVKATPSRRARRGQARFVATRERKQTKAWRKSEEEARRLELRVQMLSDEERAQLEDELRS